MTLLSFNTALLDYKILGFSFFRPIGFIEERLEAMATALLQLNADIISLQEVYSLKHQKYLIDALQKSYPFSCSEYRTSWLQLGSGLMLFSKFPIIHSMFEAYYHQPFDERLLTRKGILSAIMDTCKGYLAISNTHTTASGHKFKQDDPKIEFIRNKQIEQTMNTTLRLKQDWQCSTAFVCGDFNCSPDVAPNNYFSIETLGFVDIYKKVNVKEDPTWDTCNPLNHIRSFFKSSPNQRIDFILGERHLEHLFHQLRAQIVLKESCVTVHAHLQIPLSDHYGVIAEIK